MKGLIGKEIAIRSDGVLYKGIFIEDNKDRIKLASEDGFEVTIPKNKIAAILEKTGQKPKISAQSKESGLIVFTCFNKAMPCKGVRYVRKGTGSPKKVASEFTVACPMRNSDCRYSGGADLFNLPPKLLNEMLEQTIFGDFPEGE